MNETATPTACRSSPFGRVGAKTLASELIARERRLTLYALVLLALVVPMALLAGVDDRLVRNANVWIKPIKFALSIALLALTTAWFIGHLQPERRSGRAIDRIVWLLIGSGTFEFGYITLQAALGQGSHYNVGDLLHNVMYTLMGVGALALTATQPMLAWQLRRHEDRSRPELLRRAVRLGLWLTFVFGAGIGLLLSNVQPPDAGAVRTLPILGWSLAGGDLRPAHFIGIHAEQLLPLAAVAIAALRLPARWFGGVVLVYALAFAAAVAWGVAGRF